MTTRTAVDASTALKSLLTAEADLNQQAEMLRSKKSPGTVIFFDLVGSTGYRRRHGPEKGIRKAYLHNIQVSRAIQDCKGTVVKWMGDGVMGCFTHDACGDLHAICALNAALTGLSNLTALNSRDQNADDEIHSKVSISSGNFHYLNVGELLTGDQDLSTNIILDPIGSEVDLAARMNSMCNMDVILVDSVTFWGNPTRPANRDDSEPLGTRPICKADRDAVRWRELILSGVRETVYLPTTAGFFINEDGLSLCRVGRGSSEPIRADDFRDLVQQDAGTNGQAKRFVFCSRPIPCNIRGFPQMVDVVAITTVPHTAPLQEHEYEWYPDDIKDLEIRAEQAFRQGEVSNALRQYEEILQKDSRQFRANTRVAMILRSQRNTKRAMDHLLKAKQSNPLCPLVWGVAGITHLDDYIRDNGDKTECLTKAVTGLSRARYLAEQQFHGLLEQYCTAMLAIALLLRGNPDDKTEAKSLIDKLEMWPAKNTTVMIVKRLSSAFLDLSEKKRQGATTLKAMEELIKDVQEGRLLPNEDSAQSVPYDHLISTTDIRNLIAKAKFLMELV